jgi:hypothetical protein
VGGETKKCSKCGELKILSEFYRRTDARLGVRDDCKVCFRAAAAKYRADHREGLREKARVYRIEKRGPILSILKERRESNPEHYLKIGRRFYANHKERLRARSMDYYRSHPEESKARHKKWRQENKEYCQLKAKADTKKNKDRTRFRIMRKLYGLEPSTYDEMLANQGGLCAICGNPPAKNKHLHIDHCHKTGLVRGLLCGKCNAGIGFLNDEAALAQNAADYLADFEANGTENTQCHG